jgi:predicted nucleotidyltransferase
MEEIQRQKVDEILKVFSEVGLLNHIILIGSWCLFFYQYLFLNFVPRLRTTDIDFYLPDAKKRVPLMT